MYILFKKSYLYLYSVRFRKFSYNNILFYVAGSVFNTITMSETETSITPESFWTSLIVLLKKPHVVNKRLWGCKVLYKALAWCKDFAEGNLQFNYTKLEGLHIEEYKKQLLQEIKTFTTQEYTDLDNFTEIVLIELLPKAYTDSHAFQIVFMDKKNNLASFIDVTPRTWNQNLCPNFQYNLQLKNKTIILNSECNSSKSFKWLKDTVLPQFIKWSQECGNNEPQQICNESLSLVDTDKYYQKYNVLKLKYGKEMVKIWPECTDPSKFVYEDVAIATYLLLLWEDERIHLNNDNKQTFVDLGCGNGLLVYILTKEGHEGVGIDVRKRNIWNMFANDVKLEEKTITPSDSHLFPEADWIIGNHSDELTPWIPVIAARSSFKCNFFLLPCCAFNFDGSKYQRHDSSKSLYTEYLQYIKQLCEDCGFRTDTDRLKIPSTKRICLVGRGRTHVKEEYDDFCIKIQKIINSDIPMNSVDNESPWINDFKAREKSERVRNCTQIDKNLVDQVVIEITNHLLRNCSLEDDWTIGETVDLSEVVKLVPQDNLKALKSECGGLQTLLKNNHHIFKVQSGKVQLRYPKTVEEVTNNIQSNKNKTSNVKLKQKPCWFYNYHPHGCPLNDSECSFLHVKS